MKNRALLLLASCAWISPFSHAAPAAPPAPAPAPVAPTAPPKASWKLTADRENALYKTGEKVTFIVTLAERSTVSPDGEMFWSTDKDGVAPKNKGTVKLKGGTGTFTATLDEAGFLQCRVSEQPDGKLVSQWGVGFSPETLKPSLPVPDDFDAFWKGQLDALAKVPINPDLKPVANDKGKGLEAFDTRLDCVGEKKVSGYFVKPTGAKPKSLPAILTLHGAGVRSSNLGGAMTWGSRGFLAMDINAHGIDNGKDDAFYKGLAAGELNNYRFFDRDSREKNYFTGMFLRARRALDFLCSQPEWDGKTLVVLGGSQGGFQAFASAALDDRVTMMVATVPAGCDHTGMLAKRIAGWPKFVPSDDKGTPDPKVLEASRYIDNVNFATRNKAKTAFVSTGFIDGVCPPTSVYAAFNALPMKDKSMTNDLGAGHSVAQKTNDAARDAVVRHAKR